MNKFPQFEESSIGAELPARDAEAEARYRRAIELQPDSPEPLYHLGNFLFAIRPVEAEICYRRAIHLKPDFAAAYCNLGSVLGKQHRLDEEEACHRTAIGFDPKLAEAYNNLGRDRFPAGRLLGAHNIFDVIVCRTYHRLLTAWRHCERIYLGKVAAIRWLWRTARSLEGIPGVLQE